jgi:D-lactate dehydrogenase
MAKIGFFGCKPYDFDFITAALNRIPEADRFDVELFPELLTSSTAYLAEGCIGVCIFVQDNLDRDCIQQLNDLHVKLILCRCSGYNMVDLKAASECGMVVCYVPWYSPYSVAEFAVGLVLSITRQIHTAASRTKMGNFSIETLEGVDVHKKVVGVIGTGQTGSIFAKLMLAFGCKVIAHDPIEKTELKKLGIQYVTLDTIYTKSDFISLHLPLLPETRYMISDEAISKMKNGVYLINISRGAIIDNRALIRGLR